MPTNTSNVPTATYRVQLHAGFRFEDAAAIVDYLADLGVSDLYTSPCLQAAAGSTHGYDVVDPTRISGEIGGPTGLATLRQALGRHRLGQVLDIVPNHMGIAGRANPWWWDLLENGPASRYAHFFDLEWRDPEQAFPKVLVPILGDHYGRVLEAGDLRIDREGARFVVRYHEHVLPLTFCSLGDLLAPAAQRSSNTQLAFIADTMFELEPPTPADHNRLSRCSRDRLVLQGQLERLVCEDPAVARAIDEVLAEINSDADALDSLLKRQHYRLAWWRTAAEELNYRRFFDIDTLAAVRVDREEVFQMTHERILHWVQEGQVSGLRIDHPDGLRDPQQYFQRLAEAAPQTWIIAEKILEPGELLPASWPIDGTTGYDFIHRVGGLFVDPQGEEPLTRFYGEFTGETTDYPALVRECKHLVLRRSFGADLNRLVDLLSRCCHQHRRYCDYTRSDMREALAEVAACFPVYRTYVRPTEAKEAVSTQDVKSIMQAIDAARAARPDLDRSLLDYLRDILLLQIRGDDEAEFVLRFQQLTGSVMAKGVEDTAFYRYNRLVSLNEVGGDPSQFGLSPEAFHRGCVYAQEHWPRSMLASSTHDTKRSEDVRARLHLLSEIPQPWIEAVQRWAGKNEHLKVDGLPDRNTEYLLYQTLVGAWPLPLERALVYMRKAAKEAKRHTSWIDPNPAYEEALDEFIRGVLRNEDFTADLEHFVAPLVALGRRNALAQTLIKLTAPGVPDTYQGTELWDLSLVDPDNRRPVDYALRRRLLAELDGLSSEQILARMDEGLPKLHLIRQVLRLRRDQPHRLGPDADYQPLRAAGEKAEHVVAFVRGGCALTIAPRLVTGLGNEWGDTTLNLPAGRWRNALTGDAVAAGKARLADLLERFPAALLIAEEAAR